MSFDKAIFVDCSCGNNNIPVMVTLSKLPFFNAKRVIIKLEYQIKIHCENCDCLIRNICIPDEIEHEIKYTMAMWDHHHDTITMNEAPKIAIPYIYIREGKFYFNNGPGEGVIPDFIVNELSVLIPMHEMSRLLDRLITLEREINKQKECIELLGKRYGLLANTICTIFTDIKNSKKFSQEELKTLFEGVSDWVPIEEEVDYDEMHD